VNVSVTKELGRYFAIDKQARAHAHAHCTHVRD
jgi:hypothetical protein